MKILVTGATGFIGERYVRHLVENQPDVRVHFTGRQIEKGNALGSLTGAHYFRGDLLDVPYLQHICKDMDVVVHCAGMAGAWGDYELYYRANVTGTENLLRASAGTGVRRFVNLSSPSIYFDFQDRLNINEDFLPDSFTDNYARTKYQAEVRVANAHSDQLRTLSLRPRQVFGAGDNSLFPRIIANHQAGQLKRVGEGRNIVSTTHIANLLQALDCAVFGPDSVTGDVYNIADAQPRLMWDIIDRLLDTVNMPPVTKHVPYGVAMAAATLVEGWYKLRRSEQEPRLMRLKVAVMGLSFTLSIEKAQRKLGYRPVHSVDSAIAEFADAWLHDKTRRHPR